MEKLLIFLWINNIPIIQSFWLKCQLNLFQQILCIELLRSNTNLWNNNWLCLVSALFIPRVINIWLFQYWPSRGTETYGVMCVTLTDTQELATYVIRTFQLQRVSSAHVRHPHPVHTRQTVRLNWSLGRGIKRGIQRKLKTLSSNDCPKLQHALKSFDEWRSLIKLSEDFAFIVLSSLTLRKLCKCLRFSFLSESGDVRLSSWIHGNENSPQDIYFNRLFYYLMWFWLLYNFYNDSLP